MAESDRKGHAPPVGGGQPEDHGCSPLKDANQMVRTARHSDSAGEHAPVGGLPQLPGRGGGPSKGLPNSPAHSPPTSPEFTGLEAYGTAGVDGTTAPGVVHAQEDPIGEIDFAKQLRHEPELLYLDQDMDPRNIVPCDRAAQHLNSLPDEDLRAGELSRPTQSLGECSLGAIPSSDFLLILAELEAADLVSIECVAKDLCWPDGLGQQSLPEEAAHKKAMQLTLASFHRSGESWKQTLARADRSGYRNRLSAGWRHTILVHPAGGLFSWGNMGSGRLGIEATTNEKFLPTPTLVKNLPSGIDQISAGVNHSLMLTDTGTVYCSGYSAYASPVGETAAGWEDDTSYHEPQPILFLTNSVKVKAVSAGPMHSAAVTDSGQVFSWGFGRFGMLGHGTTDSSQDPKLVSALPPAHQISCGALFTAAVTNSGEIWTFGTGYIGHGDRSFEQHTPLKVRGLDDVAVVGMSCGKDHLALVTECGALYTFGIGRDGRLGHGSVETERTPRRVQGIGLVGQVSCGTAHTAALLRSGSLLTFGNGTNGRLGHGADENQHTPKVVEALADSDCIEVSCGGLHTVVVTSHGRCYAFGGGADGQLGLGHAKMRNAFLPELVNIPESATPKA